MADNIEVTATPSILIWHLLQEVAKYIPNANAVYQPTLSYADGLKALRDQNLSKQIVDVSALPLLLFNRSTIRNSEIFGKRSRLNVIQQQQAAKGNVGDDLTLPADKYKVLMGELDFRFMYVTTAMEELERFEMLYMTGVHIKNIKVIKIDLPDIGTVEYKVEWESLQDFELNLDDGYYKTIGATAKIHGPFIVSLGESIGTIQDIFTGGVVNLHIN
jgi:hypothetical protein